MSAEPEGVAAVEGDKPTPCPTCGGPCTATTEPDYDRDYIHGNATGPRRLYESLVKGEVVAEGWAGPKRFRLRGFSMGKPFYDDYIPVHLNHCPKDGEAVLVIRAKENARTGGKE
jgi:hypothetical protein